MAEEDLVKAYLTRRAAEYEKDTLLGRHTQSPAGSHGRPALSLAKPHECHLCDITIDGEAYLAGTYAHPLSTSLRESVLAALDGCLFHAWIADTVSTSPHFRKLNDGKLEGYDCRLALMMPQSSEDWELGPYMDVGVVSSTAAEGEGAGPASGSDDHTLTLSTNGWCGHLVISTGKDDPAAQITPRRPHELDQTSGRTFEFAKQCLQKCTSEHRDCQLPLGPPEDNLTVPSRVLSISPGCKAVRLVAAASLSVDERKEIVSTGYVALSYCWGGPQPVTLNGTSQRDLEAGISVDRLPATLKDALRVAHEIGIRYIWIDSLCILQDDASDKEHEIARLSSYYSRATVTICAASAASCREGILKTGREPDYIGGPFRIKCSTSSGMGSLLLYSSIEPAVPISARGWTLQESLLSRRILVFSASQLFWTCAVANATCGGPFPEMKNRIFGIPESYVPDVYPRVVFTALPARDQWMKIVRNFTARKLGFEGDKLLAVSAVAEVVAGQFALQEGHERTQYLAGLFIDPQQKRYWVLQLLWNALPGSSRPVGEYRAPSWSWASLDGQVENSLHRHTGRSRPTDDDPRCDILDAKVELSLATAKYGGVVDAWLLLRARLRPLPRRGGLPNRIQVIWGGEESDPWYLDERFLALWPDTEADKTLIDQYLVGATATQVQCLELVHYQQGGVAPLGLLLTPADQPGYRRIGVFVANCGAGEAPQDENAARDLFRDDMYQDVLLI